MIRKLGRGSELIYVFASFVSFVMIVKAWKYVDLYINNFTVLPINIQVL
jgi:hypothetical protein